MPSQDYLKKEPKKCFPDFNNGSSWRDNNHNTKSNVFFIFINYEDVDVYEKVLMATRRQIGAGKALKDEDPMYSV